MMQINMLRIIKITKLIKLVYLRLIILQCQVQIILLGIIRTWQTQQWVLRE